MARTRAHPPRRLAMSRASRRSLKRVVRPAPPLPPEEGFSPGVCLQQSGLLGRRTPDHNPPPEEGLMLTRERPLLASLGCRWFWLPSLVCRALYPSPPEVASGGYGRPGCRGSPPPATGSNNREQHSRAIGRRLDPRPPGPGGVPDEGQLLHHLRPSPQSPSRRLTGNGDPPTRNNQNTGI